MEQIVMKYVNHQAEKCLVIVDEKEDELMILNKDKGVVEARSPMLDVLNILEDINFEEDDLYVLDVEGFLKFVENNREEINDYISSSLKNHLKEL